MAPAILEEGQQLQPGEVATLPVYITKELKRTVLVKDDDILFAAEIRKHTAEVTQAINDELRIWLENTCFKMILFKDARNVMSSRYVAKWKWI